MEKFDIQFTPASSQIRCIAHVVNLVVQKFLSALDEASDPKDDDYYVPSKDQPFHYDVNNDPIQRALETEPILVDADDAEEERVDHADAALLGELADEFADLTPLKKLRLICTKICSSPQRRRAFRLIADEKYGGLLHAPHRRLTSLLPVRDVKHRWNYTEAMITRARLLRAVKEWTMLEKLGNILTEFTNVTLQMSKSKTPTLPWVLPMYEQMLQHLTKASEDAGLPSALQLAAGAGLVKLKHYYNKAQNCQFYVIATILHPCLGLSWFAAQTDRKERMERAKVLFQHVYESYKNIFNDEMRTKNTAPAAVCTARPAGQTSFLDRICSFDVSAGLLPAVQAGELELFYAAPITYGTGTRKGLLVWWKVSYITEPSMPHLTKLWIGIWCPLSGCLTDGTRLPRHPSAQCIHRVTVLPVTASVPRGAIINEG
ncbi:hypothetical protein DFH08DRAFT_698294 [Mycena albidolilacea]|uniref:Uncharacterized protein n=1 Tax=Mycena albidolilacea TaxID=1033008 RepID=A0AAD7ESD2_9AGAR|nr:hypothetical protein DFH08DRAFT_698294 [Mycena albidolilacea]